MSDEVQLQNAANAGVPKKELQVKLTCPVHGDISKSTLIVSLEDLRERAKPESERKVNPEPLQFLYCLHCLNEKLLKMQEDGTLPRVDVTPIPPAEINEAAPAKETQA